MNEFWKFDLRITTNSNGPFLIQPPNALFHLFCLFISNYSNDAEAHLIFEIHSKMNRHSNIKQEISIIRLDQPTHGWNQSNIKTKRRGKVRKNRWGRKLRNIFTKKRWKRKRRSNRRVEELRVNAAFFEVNLACSMARESATNQ